VLHFIDVLHTSEACSLAIQQSFLSSNLTFTNAVTPLLAPLSAIITAIYACQAKNKEELI